MIQEKCRCINRCNHTRVILSFICPARLQTTRNYPFSCMMTAGSRVQHTILLNELLRRILGPPLMTTPHIEKSSNGIIALNSEFIRHRLRLIFGAILSIEPLPRYLRLFLKFFSQSFPGYSIIRCNFKALFFGIFCKVAILYFSFGIFSYR